MFLYSKVKYTYLKKRYMIKATDTDLTRSTIPFFVMSETNIKLFMVLMQIV